MTTRQQGNGNVVGLVVLTIFTILTLLFLRDPQQRAALAHQTFQSPIDTPTPTATHTVVPTATPTKTATPEPKPAAPVVTGISPASGPTDTASEVIILGAYFVDTPTVRVGEKVVADVDFVSSYKLRAKFPANMEPGTYNVQVCNPDGQCGTLAQGFMVTGAAPALLNMVPRQGFSNVPNDIVLYGANLQPGITVTVGNKPVEDITWAPGTDHMPAQVRGVLPAGLIPGTYDVVARNPGSSLTGTLPRAYLALDPAGDDLFVTTDDIWTSPVTIRQGDTVTLGANIHRQGGEGYVKVDVAFYLGDPNAGGLLLGQTQTPPMPPGYSVARHVSIKWDTTGLSDVVTVYVVVDPEGRQAESTRANNIASRSLTILPADGDTTPPIVTSLTINRGDLVTDIPDILVEIEAFDRGGAGLSMMYLAEREFNSSARQWITTQRTGWIPFSPEYTLTLTGRGGTRFIQVWVADAAGNISEDRNVARIDYMPPRDRLRAGQTRIYRRLLDAGWRLTATVESLSGDADLYVWSPDGKRSWVSDKPGSQTDVVSFVAPQAGDYQIEVHGYEDTEYRLSIQIQRAGYLAAAEQHEMPRDAGPDHVASSKGQPPQPVIPPDNEPAHEKALPLAPVTSTALLRTKIAVPVVSVASLQPADFRRELRFIPFLSYRH